MTKRGFAIKPGVHPICPIMLYDAKLAQDFARLILAELLRDTIERDRKLRASLATLNPTVAGAGTLSGSHRPFACCIRHQFLDLNPEAHHAS